MPLTLRKNSARPAIPFTQRFLRHFESHTQFQCFLSPFNRTDQTGNFLPFSISPACLLWIGSWRWETASASVLMLSPSGPRNPGSPGLPAQGCQVGRLTTRTGSLLLMEAALSRVPPPATRLSSPAFTSSLELWSLCSSGNRFYPGRKRSHSIAPSHLEKDASSPGLREMLGPQRPGPASRALFTSHLHVAHCWEHTGPFLPGGRVGTEHSHSRLLKEPDPLEHGSL